MGSGNFQGSLDSPTLYRERGFRFVVWSNDFNEPPHVHAIRGTGKGAPSAKFWLNPVRLCINYSLGHADLRRAQQIVTVHA